MNRIAVSFLVFQFLMSFSPACIFAASQTLTNVPPTESSRIADSSQRQDFFDEYDQRLDKIGQSIKFRDQDIMLKFSGEARYRLEYRDDFNFDDRTYEDDAINLFRTRLGAEAEFYRQLKFFVQGQDSESVANQSAHRNASFVNQLDLRQLYVDIKSPFEKNPGNVKVGRQELSYGDQRLIGSGKWTNPSRVFDAVKLSWGPWGWFQVDTFFSRVVKTNRSKPDSADHHDNLYGIYTVAKPVTDHSIDTFILMRHDRNNEIVGEIPGARGQLKEYTFGNRLKGKKSNFDYGIEWARQMGSRAHEGIHAWSWHSDIGYTFVKLPWQPHPNLEYNHGSGDGNGRDGEFQNFDNLYPTNHNYYGFMDFASWRNLDHFKLGSDFSPHSKLKLTSDYHWLFLDTNGAAWFDSGSRVIRAAKSGADVTLGQEIDLLAKWKVAKHLEIWLGYSHFHAGAFAKDTGSHNNANFFYVQTSIEI